MAYQAPTIVDRVALGDDKYTITDLPDGRKLLTPAPDSVTEPGTEINKALLDPLCKAVERIDGSTIPYTLYWWRRRATATSYTENRVTARSQGGCTSHHESGQNSTCYYVYFYQSESSRTIQVASAISINQTNGAITLKNPTSYSYTESSFNRDTFQSLCAGKYVKGLSPNVDSIYYIPSNAYIGTYSWEVSGESVTYIGYEVRVYDSDGSVSGIDILMPFAIKNTATGDWESVSSPDPNAYPKNGTSGGYDWAYLGTISDAVTTIPANAQARINSISITASMYSNLVATISIPAKLALVMIPGGGGRSDGFAFGLLDTVSGTFYGIVKSGESSTDSTDIPHMSATSSWICTLKYGNCNLYACAGGLQFKLESASKSYTNTIYWLPLDSLEVG